MSTERTFAIIKPDAVEKGAIGRILGHIEETGLKPIAIRMHHLSRHEAEGFYAVHKERPFFGELVEFMTRGPVVLLCLEGEDAIKRWRDLMGATNPADAAEGTLRKLYGTDVGENATHGSDAPETAAFELNWFFRESELTPYPWKK